MRRALQLRPPSGGSSINRLTVASAGCWLAVVAVMAFAVVIGETSWIGLSACFSLIGWSIVLRLWERYCLKLATVKAYGPDQSDAIYILGRRNSCFILQRSRKEVLKWKGQGLEQREGEEIDLICTGTRIGSLAMLLYLLIIIPNGTTWNQVAFIMLNILGQLNALLGQRVNAKACLDLWGLLTGRPTVQISQVRDDIRRTFSSLYQEVAIRSGISTGSHRIATNRPFSTSSASASATSSTYPISTKTTAN